MLVNGYFVLCCIEERGLAMWSDKEGGSATALFEKSAHLLVESSIKRALLSTIQTNLIGRLFPTMLIEYHLKESMAVKITRYYIKGSYT